MSTTDRELFTMAIFVNSDNYCILQKKGDIRYVIDISVRLRSWIPAFVAGVLLCLQIFSPAPPIMSALLVIASVLLLSFVWARQLAKGLSLNRQRRYGWAQVGDIIEERFIMHNDSWVPVLWARLLDHSNLPGYNAGRAVGLGPRDSTYWKTEGRCTRRGVYRLGPAELSTGDPFGLFEVTLEHNYSEEFVVYPPIAALPDLLQPRGMARGSARANVRSLELTTNASSVRPYVPGDALNRIHWPSTARRSMPGNEEIFVKEFDLEPSGDLWLVLDLDEQVHAGEGVESTEEYAVILAASLANEMLRANHAVGLMTYMEKPIVIPPQKGHEQLWELLRILAGAHAQAQIDLHELLGIFETVMGRGMSVALLTPSGDPAWIKGISAMLRHSIHPTALLLDGRTFGGDGNVSIIREALLDLGVPGHIIEKGFEFQRISRERQQRPTYKVLGTGRVIVDNAGAEDEAEWMPVGRGRM
ncbi:MAG: DUF58 domain-containing protein [Chloroflexota bacterium]|nr:DUF58 domain-containing protein [Chloroflexota bacterium]